MQMPDRQVDCNKKYKGGMVNLIEFSFKFLENAVMSRCPGRIWVDSRRWPLCGGRNRGGPESRGTGR